MEECEQEGKRETLTQEVSGATVTLDSIVTRATSSGRREGREHEGTTAEWHCSAAVGVVESNV